MADKENVVIVGHFVGLYIQMDTKNKSTIICNLSILVEKKIT